MSQRMAKRLTKPDMSRKSIYDKDMKATLSNKPNSTDWLGRKKYGTKAFGGDKAYTHTPKFKTNEFTTGKEKTKLGTEKFSQAGKKPSYADQSFATKSSVFDKKSSRDANKTFGPGKDVYKTTPYRDALKSQEKNDRPKMVELEKGKSKPAYTEDQVRSLMGRQ